MRRNVLGGFGFLFVVYAGLMLPHSVWAAPSVTLTPEIQRIDIGASGNISWTISGATRCTASDSTGASSNLPPTSGGPVTVSPGTNGNHYYYVECWDANNVSSGRVQSLVQVGLILTFSGSPTTLTAGQSATLSWNASGNPAGTNIFCPLGDEAGNSLGWKDETGNLSVSPTVTTTYVMSCRNEIGGRIVGIGSQIRRVTITVNPAPACSGDVSWLSDCRGKVTTPVASGSSVNVTNTNAGFTGSASFTCNGSTFSEATGATCRRNSASPSVTLRANGVSDTLALATSGPVTLSWSVTGGVTSCLTSGGWGAGSLAPLEGSRVQQVAATSTFSVECFTATGISTGLKSVTVTVGSGSGSGGVVNGICAPTHNNCLAGTSSTPQSDTTYWYWNCEGSSGGSRAVCNELKSTSGGSGGSGGGVVNGICAPTHNNCLAGTSSTPQSDTAYWYWNCEGSSGGSRAVCNELKSTSGGSGSIPAPTLTLTVDRDTIAPGEWAYIHVNTDGFQCWLSGGTSTWDNYFENKVKLAELRGIGVQPQFTTTYTAECFSISGLSSGEKSITVRVTDGLLLLAVMANPDKVDPVATQATVISWRTSRDVASCKITRDGRGVEGWTRGNMTETNGSRTVTFLPGFNGETFYMECFDSFGTSTGERNIYVNASPGATPPVVHICPSSLDLRVGERKSLKAFIVGGGSRFNGDCAMPNGTDVTNTSTWSTDQSVVATAGSGMATGIGNGSTTLRVNYTGYKGSIPLTVTGDVSPSPGSPGQGQGPPTASGSQSASSLSSGSPYFNPLKFNSVEGVLTGVITQLRNIIVILSIIFIIIGAVMYILSAGNESRMNTAKGAITAALIGLTLAIAAPAFLKEIASILGWTNITDASNTIAGAQTFTQIATKVLDFLLSIVGIIGIIMLVFGGFVYLTSAGDENKAETGKKIVTYAIIAIALALSALVLVTQVAKFFA